MKKLGCRSGRSINTEKVFEKEGGMKNDSKRVFGMGRLRGE
jgi:hypothetical protein